MANTTNFGWETPDDTDLVKDGAAAIRTLAGAIDTSLVDLKGGTTGQVLSKATNTDMDFTWVAQDDSNAIQNAIIDAKGDLIVGTAADTPARLAVGTNGYVLTADSAETAGVKWAAAAGGGKVLQVVQAVYTTASTNTTETYADTGLTASITPSSSSSKVLVFISQGTLADRASGSCGNHLQILRGATVVHENTRSGGIAAGGASSTSLNSQQVLIYLDSPATTSSTTYKTQGRLNTATASSVVVFQENSRPSTITLMEIGA